MAGLPSGRDASPWSHTEGIGAARVDTPRAALKSGGSSRQEMGGGRAMTDAKTTPRERPTSPHLMTGGLGSPLLWRWHITMWTSILHRATGCALYVGALIAAAWAISLAQGPDHYAAFKSLLGSLPGKVVMLGLTVCVFYHLANGVRHLVWDAGVGFAPKTATAVSVAILAFTAAATAAIWAIAAMTGAL